MENLPEELNSIKPFLVRSEEMKTADPVISYYCYRYATQLAMEIRKQNQSNAEVTNYIGNMLNVMEAKKREIVDVENPKEHYEKFMTMLFISADNDDRKNGSTKKTAQKFLILSYFIEAFNVFEDLRNDWEEKRIYCKWKTADILKAIKNGQQPLPGGPNERDGKEEVKSPAGFESGYTANPMNYGGDEFKPSLGFQASPLAGPPPSAIPPNLGPAPQFYPSGGYSYIPPSSTSPDPPQSYSKPPEPKVPARSAAPASTPGAIKPQEIPARPQIDAKPDRGSARQPKTIPTNEQRKIIEQAKKFSLDGVQEIEYKNIPQAIAAFQRAVQILETYHS